MRSRCLVIRRAVYIAALWVPVVFGAFGEGVHAKGHETQTDVIDLRPRTVAVVPFANVSGRPEDEWIGVGIAETVTADLEQFVDLTVVGREALVDLVDRRTEAAPNLSDETVALDLARRLGVSWIVAGGFQRLDTQLRITAQIVSVESGTAHETVKVDGGLREIFTLQDRIVEELRDGFARIASSESEPPFAAPEAADNTAPSPELSVGQRPGPSPELLPGQRSRQRPGPLPGRVTVRPVRIQTPPAIDGRLDDEVWSEAFLITDFVQSDPLDGAPATEETEVYLAYDSSNIYLGFHARYEDPGIMRANRVDRDRADRGDDIIRVYFDTFLDQQRAYAFSVNGYGVQGDSIIGGSRRGGGLGGGGRSSRTIPFGDRSWDALFSTGGQLVDDGFTAEMAIPFKSLRYPARGTDLPHTWGFQIVRSIRGKDETVVWSPVSRDVAGFLPQMGVLDGITGLSTSRNFEVQPTFTAFRFGTLDEETGQVVDGDPRPEGGANFKYGLTSDLVSNFTINPDFSQIESDRPQVEVNQRFALFYPELRPFFLEGAEVFEIEAPVTARAYPDDRRSLLWGEVDGQSWQCPDWGAVRQRRGREPRDR